MSEWRMACRLLRTAIYAFLKGVVIMKAAPAIFASLVLLTSSAALAADTPRPDRAAAVKHCESLSNPEQTRCMREVRNTYDDKREPKSAKDNYWSPERMAARAKQRIKSVANKIERAVERKPEPDTTRK